MSINLLTDKLPSAVFVRGKAYPVFTDFRHWIRFFAMLDSDNSSKKKAVCALRWYKSDIPDSISEAVDALISFARCDESPGEPTEDELGRAECAAELATAAKDFDWSFDSGYILGAFLQAYHIDLTVTKMHWYKFHALLAALPEDTLLKKRIYYRGIRIGNIKDDAQRAEIMRIQDAIRIPAPELTAEQVGSTFGAAMTFQKEV